MKEAIVHRMDVFEMGGHLIGPLILTLDKVSWQITVNLDSTVACHRSTRGWIHPNVMAGGRIYWKNSQAHSPADEAYSKAKASHNHHEWLHYAVEYLRDAPTDFDGYHELSTWTEPVESVYVLNVKLTTHIGTSDECWGVFTSRDGAEARLISPQGITWHADGEHCKFFEGHRNTDCDEHFPGLVEASATIDKHIVQE